jgi:hypothetical protein
MTDGFTLARLGSDSGGLTERRRERTRLRCYNSRLQTSQEAPVPTELPEAVGAPSSQW